MVNCKSYRKEISNFSFSRERAISSLVHCFHSLNNAVSNIVSRSWYCGKKTEPWTEKRWLTSNQTKSIHASLFFNPTFQLRTNAITPFSILNSLFLTYKANCVHLYVNSVSLVARWRFSGLSQPSAARCEKFSFLLELSRMLSMWCFCCWCLQTDSWTHNLSC